MQKMKKILIICLIITLLMPILPPTSEATMTLQVETPGLTQEQQDYLVAYVNLYLEEAYKMNPRPFVYDSKNGGYNHHYYQNEWSTSQLGQSGVSTPGGEVYSNRMRTVCSVFTGSMLHQALGVDIWNTGIRGTGYANPNGRGERIF